MELTDLIEAIDIVEYISQYVVLERRGDEWWGLSPFKEEKTPSFSVRQETHQFYDYSSGKAGNTFTFIRMYHKCGPTEAVNIMKSYLGYDGEMAAPKKKLSMVQTCKKFAKPKTSSLPKEQKGTVLPDDYMDRFEDGGDKLNVWRGEGITDEAMEKFGVMYDSYSNRIVYPIRNMDGKIINVGGRTLDPDFKAKKIRKYTYFFNFGTIDVIYGVWDNLHAIKEQREVILFEGCKSVLKAYGWGIQNCGAILTSHLSSRQMKILAKLGCRVVFALDKDVDIREDHNIQKLKRYVDVEYIYDAADWLNEKDAPVDQGEEVFKNLYDKRIKYR